MGSSVERSKKKAQLWKKTIHFFLCFVMGFFTGFAPTSKYSLFSSHVVLYNTSEFSPQPLEILHQTKTQSENFNGSLMDETPEVVSIRFDEPKRAKIVEIETRETGIMYRHLVFKQNFTDLQAEMDHQRNFALNHIEQHRLSGIVHFAGLTNVYNLRFFDEIRSIEGFGTWPMAFLSANTRTVKIEGPICDSSEVIGWHLKKMNNLTVDSGSPTIHISSFAFNSSILWDPERWGRPSSVQDTSQNSLKFVKKEVLDEETKLKGIPSDSCSKVMLWNLNIPT